MRLAYKSGNIKSVRELVNSIKVYKPSQTYIIKSFNIAIQNGYLGNIKLLLLKKHDKNTFIYNN